MARLGWGSGHLTIRHRHNHFRAADDFVLGQSSYSVISPFTSSTTHDAIRINEQAPLAQISVDPTRCRHGPLYLDLCRAPVHQSRARR